MLVHVRAILIKSWWRRLIVNAVLKQFVAMLERMGITHALIVITDGKFGCVELSNMLPENTPGWTAIFKEPPPDDNRPSLH